MLNARFAALVTILIWTSTLVSPTIFAQDAEGLPPGIRSVEVDGQPIDAVTVPTTNNPTPEISGRVDLAVPVIELVVGDDGAIRVSAEVDERGRFSMSLCHKRCPMASIPSPSMIFPSARSPSTAPHRSRTSPVRPRTRQLSLAIGNRSSTLLASCRIQWTLAIASPGSGSSMVAISHSRKKPPAPPRLRVRQPRNKCVTRNGVWVKPVGCSAMRTDSRCQTRPIPRRSISRYRRLWSSTHQETLPARRSPR